MIAMKKKLLILSVLYISMFQVDASASVIASSRIVSVGPNLGSFVSPVTVSCMTGLCGLTRIADRFLVSAVAVAVICCVLLIKSGREITNMKTILT